jgi:hypothetical protein
MSKYRPKKLMLDKNEKELITRIRDCEVIWNKSHKEYRKPSTTETAWLNIAEALGEDGLY